MSRARAWCFTINNYTIEEINACDEIECNYIIYGDEIGDTGTPHLQGYIEFENAKTLTSVRKSLGGRAHVEQEEELLLKHPIIVKNKVCSLKEVNSLVKDKELTLKKLLKLLKMKVSSVYVTKNQKCSLSTVVTSKD